MSKPAFNSPTTRSKKKTAAPIDSTSENVDVKDSSEEDVVGPLCTSMKKLTSMTEQNYEQQMKTPNESSASSKTSAEVARGASFRKSLVFDSGLTPHDNETNTSTSTNKSTDNESNERPKAKTSLTFNEPVISVRSFYGKTVEKSLDEPTKPALDIITKLNGHEIVAAIAKQKHRSKPKTTKPKLLAKRMKAPSLWRFSGKMKFNRHIRPRSHKEGKKKKEKLKASINSNGTNGIDTENVAPIGAEFTSRIEQNLRLQKILKDQTNAFGASRDINWNGATKMNDSTLIPSTDFLHSDGEDDGDSDNECTVQPNCSTYEEVEVEVEEPTNRKFFKSSGSSAKKYRIMGRLSATLKRGGDLKFDPPPKRRKKRPNKGRILIFQFFLNLCRNIFHLLDGETVFLHNEISSIIDRLSSPSKNKRNITTTSDTNSNQCDMNLDQNTNAQPDNPQTVSMTCPVITPEKHSAAEHDVAVTIEQITIVENQPEFIEEMQTEHTVTIETSAFDDVEKFRQMIPYDTIDPEKISQQESILELLISNGICNQETFQIFIAEPDLHKEKASQILDSLYCVNTMMPIEYENDVAIEWVDSVDSVAIAQTSDSVAIEGNSNSFTEATGTALNSMAVLNCGESTAVGNSTTQSQAARKCGLRRMTSFRKKTN